MVFSLFRHPIVISVAITVAISWKSNLYNKQGDDTSSISNLEPCHINDREEQTQWQGESGTHYSNETIPSQMIQSENPIRSVMTQHEDCNSPFIATIAFPLTIYSGSYSTIHKTTTRSFQFQRVTGRIQCVLDKFRGRHI